MPCVNLTQSQVNEARQKIQDKNNDNDVNDI